MSIPRFAAMKAAKNEESGRFADKIGETFQQFNAKGSNILSNSFGQRKISQGGFISPGSSPTLAVKFFHASKPDNFDNNSSMLSSAKNWLPNWTNNC